MASTDDQTTSYAGESVPADVTQPSIMAPVEAEEHTVEPEPPAEAEEHTVEPEPAAAEPEPAAAEPEPPAEAEEHTVEPEPAAAEPEPAAEAEEHTVEPEPAAAEPESAAEPETAARTRRKRAARKAEITLEQTDDGRAEDDRAGQEQAGEDATEVAAAKKKSGRKSPKRHPKKKKASAHDEAAPEAGEPLLERAENTAGGETAAEQKRAEETAATAPDVGDEPLAKPAKATAEPAAPAAPGFGLLFQAPDLDAAPVRRRATRKASAPVSTPAHESLPADGAAAGNRSGAGPDAVSGDTRPSDVPGEDAHGAPRGAGEPDDTDVDQGDGAGRRRRRRGGKGRRGRSADAAAESGSEQGGEESAADQGGRSAAPEEDSVEDPGSRRRRRRRRSGSGAGESDDPPGTVTRVREPRARDEVSGVKGSTRLEAKKQRRREGREAGRRRTVITEAEFLARRESVDRAMVVRDRDGRTQIAVLEDGVLVEHYVSRETNASMAGNIYLGRVQNVLPSMEAAFVDIGKGRNAVLYAGEVNWDAAGLEMNAPKRIENALKSGDSVLVQVTKDPIGHKGARLTSQISLPGRYLVYVPEGSMTGISRKLPDTERSRLKAILKEVVPDSAGVIVRTAAEGASEEELRADVERLTAEWERIRTQAGTASGRKASAGGAPVLVHGEPDLTVRVIRDIFNEDFASLVVQGEQAWNQVKGYVADVAPDLSERVTRWTEETDAFAHHRVTEQLAKAMDRKVWLPSGGSLVIDRTEAMTVVDVNTGKFVGSGGNLEETVTKNNIEAAEEIVRQLRLRDIGGIIVIDFIDMVLESNRDLVVRRLLECLGRDRTKHQVAEVTSLGLVQMTRKRVGSGLIEVFSEPCEACHGRGIIVHTEPVDKPADSGSGNGGSRGAGGRGRGRGNASGNGSGAGSEHHHHVPAASAPEPPAVPSGPTAAQIAAAAHAAALKASSTPAAESSDDASAAGDVAPLAEVAPALAGSESTSEEPASTPGEGEPTAEEQVSAPAESRSTHEDPASTPSEGEPTGEEQASVRSTEPSPAEVTAALAETHVPDGSPEPVTVAERTAYEPPPATVLGRPRRKRGRVVAPAGPPSPAGTVPSSPEAGQASPDGPAGPEG